MQDDPKGLIPDNQSLKDAILDHPFWYHRIRLDSNFYTPGYVSAQKFDELNPPNLNGKSVIDIGLYNGLFGFEAERHGAKRVLATDLWDLDERDQAPEQTHRRQGFELVREFLDSDVESRSLDLCDVSPEMVGAFDIVFCGGVIYRLKNPFQGIENLVSIADEQVILSSLQPKSLSSESAMEFHEMNGCLNDPSIWWTPTRECLNGMLRSAGCDRVDICEPNDETNERVPPVSNANVTDPPIVIYQDHELTQKIDHRSPRDTGRESPSKIGKIRTNTVSVLYQTGSAARIMYTVDGNNGMVERKQGWIDSDHVELDTGQTTPTELLAKSDEIIRSEGFEAFYERAKDYVIGENRVNEYIVHAFPG